MIRNGILLFLVQLLFTLSVFSSDEFVCPAFECSTGKRIDLLTVNDKRIIGTVTSCGETLAVKADTTVWQIDSDSILTAVTFNSVDSSRDTTLSAVRQLTIGRCFFSRRCFGKALEYLIKLQKNEQYGDTAIFFTAEVYAKLGMLKPALATNLTIASDVRELSKEAAWQRYGLFRQLNISAEARDVAAYILSTYPDDMIADSCRIFLERGGKPTVSQKNHHAVWIPAINLSGNTRYGMRTSSVVYDEVLGYVPDVTLKDSSELRWVGKLKVLPQWNLPVGVNNSITVHPSIAFSDPASNFLEQSLEGGVSFGFKRIRGLLKGHSAEFLYKTVQYFEPYEFDRYRFRFLYAAGDLASYSLNQFGVRWNYIARMKKGMYCFYSLAGTLQKSRRSYLDGHYFDATAMFSPLFTFGSRTTVSLWTTGILTSFPVIGGTHTTRVHASGLGEGKSVADTVTIHYYTDSERTKEQPSGGFFTGFGSKPKASSAVRYAEPSGSTVVGTRFSASYAAPALSLGLKTRINNHLALNIRPSVTLFFYQLSYLMDNAENAERYNGEVITFINDDGGMYITNDIDNGTFTELRQQRIRRWDLKSGIECSLTYTHSMIGKISLYVEGGMVRSTLLNDKRITPEYEEVFGGLEWKRDISFTAKGK